LNFLLYNIVLFDYILNLIINGNVIINFVFVVECEPKFISPDETIFSFKYTYNFKFNKFVFFGISIVILPFINHLPFKIFSIFIINKLLLINNSSTNKFLLIKF
jgi:hypothetical protein